MRLSRSNFKSLFFAVVFSVSLFGLGDVAAWNIKQNCINSEEKTESLIQTSDYTEGFKSELGFVKFQSTHAIKSDRNQKSRLNFHQFDVYDLINGTQIKSDYSNYVRSCQLKTWRVQNKFLLLILYLQTVK